MHKAKIAIAQALIAATALAGFVPSMAKAQVSPNNQNVAVTATVDLTLTFSIDDQAIVLGTLATGSTKWAGPSAQAASELKANTLSLSTNSTTGFSVSMGGTTLTSGSDTINAAAPGSAPTPGTEQFGVAFDNESGLSIDAGYDQDTNDYGFVTTGDTGVLTSSDQGSATVDAYYMANIATTTQAGNYSANVQFSATASM